MISQIKNQTFIEKIFGEPKFFLNRISKILEAKVPAPPLQKRKKKLKAASKREKNGEQGETHN